MIIAIVVAHGQRPLKGVGSGRHREATKAVPSTTAYQAAKQARRHVLDLASARSSGNLETQSVKCQDNRPGQQQGPRDKRWSHSAALGWKRLGRPPVEEYTGNKQRGLDEDGGDGHSPQPETEQRKIARVARQDWHISAVHDEIEHPVRKRDGAEQ